jgi:hypothetical protein
LKGTFWEQRKYEKNPLPPPPPNPKLKKIKNKKGTLSA